MLFTSNNAADSSVGNYFLLRNGVLGLMMPATAMAFPQSFRRLFVGMVTRTYHRTDGGIGKAQFVCFFFKYFELFGCNVAQDRQVAV